MRRPRGGSAILTLPLTLVSRSLVSCTIAWQIVVDEIAALGCRFRVVDLDAEDEFHTRRQGHAHVNRYGEGVKSAVVDGELPLDEVEEIAAGARNARPARMPIHPRGSPNRKSAAGGGCD